MMFKPNAWWHNTALYFSQHDATATPKPITGKLRSNMRHWLPLLGWTGIVAIGLLAICLTFYVTTIRPMQARSVASEHHANSERERLANASDAAHGGNATPREQLTEFYHFFPTEKSSPIWLEKLVVVAEKNALSLNDGEYKVTQDKIGQLMRYKITLPVRGKYTQIRKFLASLRTEIPVIALENVQFERGNIIDSAVQAKIKLVLYLVQES
jgi:hypothetical protein